jgi:hypothetical protein
MMVMRRDVWSYVQRPSHGGAVAQANVVRAVRRSYEKLRNSTPCRSETVELVDTKFWTIDNVAETSESASFGCNWPHGGAPACAWNITFACPFLFFISPLSDARTARTGRRRKTRNGSNDADSPKDVHFRGFIIMSPPTGGIISPNLTILERRIGISSGNVFHHISAIK